MYITRAIESLVRTYAETFKVVAVTGPRQVGKTTMLKHLIAQDEAQGIHRNYVSLDELNVRMQAKDDPALFLQRYAPPVLIDEIQNAPELLPSIKAYVDAHDNPGLIWLTGSQPLHLMKAVSESLAGRVGILEMAGLSDAEIFHAPSEPFIPSPEYFLRRTDLSQPLSVTEVYERILAGSMPGIRSLDPFMRANAYESYIDTYIMRDIRDLAQVADEIKFRRFLSACGALTGRPLVYSELARLSDVTEKTAKVWVSLLSSTYLVRILQPVASNALKRLVKQPLLMFVDTGLAAHLAGWRDPITLMDGPLSGFILQTFVFSEIYKSYLNSGIRPPLSFYRDNDRREIDLVVESQGVLYPVEVKKSASPNRGDAKHFKALDGLANPQKSADGIDMLGRKAGLGTVIGLTSDAYPLATNLWAFPAWAV